MHLDIKLFEDVIIQYFVGHLSEIMCGIIFEKKRNLNVTLVIILIWIFNFILILD